MINKKIDRRKKYYLILDCETATLPCAMNYCEKLKSRIAIAKPLIYDIGWRVIDRKGKVYKEKSFLISEIFSVPQIFNTAYYASKKPIYLSRLQRNETILTDWNTAINELVDDMQFIEGVGAYNSMFDFKKAISFTEAYITALYSPNFYEWEKMQNKICEEKAEGVAKQVTKTFEQNFFCFRGKNYNLFDVWGLSCQHIMNNNDYKKMCLENNWKTASGKYFKTSAETCFRFYSKEIDFVESHTAIDDVAIESELFVEILRLTRNKFKKGIIFFPFKILGTIEEFESLKNEV